MTKKEFESIVKNEHLIEFKTYTSQAAGFKIL